MASIEVGNRSSFDENTLIQDLKVFSQSRKSEFRVFSTVHLNITKIVGRCTQPISTNLVDMTDIAQFTEPENKMVNLLPWEP